MSRNLATVNAEIPKSEICDGNFLGATHGSEDGATHIFRAMASAGGLVVQMMAVKLVRHRMLQHCDSSLDADAISYICSDEFAPIPVRRMTDMLGFRSRYRFEAWMDEKGATLPRNASLPRVAWDIQDNIWQELSRTPPPIDPAILEAYEWLNVIADKLKVPADLGAIMLAIEGREKAVVDEQIRVADLMIRLELESSRRQSAENRAKEYCDEIESMETQLSAMCASKCASGEYEARQALKQVQRLLDSQWLDLREKDAILRDMRERIEVLEEDRRRQKELMGQLERENQVCEQERERLGKSLIEIEMSNARVRELWPNLAVLHDNAARDAGVRDHRGYRWDETMRDLVLRAQIVPKAVWNEFFVGFGFPSWKTKNAIFYRALGAAGLGPQVFDGRPDHIEALLALYLGEDRGCRCCVSIDAISVTASLSVDLRNRILVGGVQEIELTEEQVDALRLNRDLLQVFLAECQVDPVTALWIVCINVVDEVPGKHSLPIAVLPACKGVADDSIVAWFAPILLFLSRYPWIVGFASDGDPCFIRNFLRPVACKLLATDLSYLPVTLLEMPGEWLLFRHDDFELPFIPDARHLIKNLRCHYIKGEIAAVPCLDAFVIGPSRFIDVGMSAATVADRRCYHQDDLKAEEFFRHVHLARSAELFDQAFSAGDVPSAGAFGSVYLALLPAYCLVQALLGNELSDADRYSLLSFAFAFAVLWAGEYERAYKRLPKKLQRQKMRASAKAGESGKCRTLFDWDSLHKLVVLAPLLARELFPSRATRLGALGTIQQEHVHAEVRLLGHNDQRCSSICHGILRSLAKHIAGGVSSGPVRVPSHRSSRGEAILPPRDFVPPLVTLPAVFRHVIALVRHLTGCFEFARWAPEEFLPHGGPDDFVRGQMWPHLLTRWPPLAQREVHFLSSLGTRICSTSGLSNLRRWAGAGLLRPCAGRGDAGQDEVPG
jgi:hypothetical protein